MHPAASDARADRSWARRLAAVALVIVVVAVAVAAGGARVVQRRLTYFPAGAPPPVTQVLPGASEVTLETDDGLDLAAWYLRSGPVAVAVLPGNAGNRAARAPLARALADRGLSVLLVDYRGYGGNPGRPTQAGLAADARAAQTWLEDRSDVDDVVLFGESIGAAVAVAVAAERRPAALVLRSPFTSLGDVARVHYGPVPDWLLRDRFASRDRIDEVTAPLLVVAGEADRIVPILQSRQLFEAATEPKRFVAVPGAGHNDAALLDGPILLDAVSSFLSDHGLLPDA